MLEKFADQAGNRKTSQKNCKPRLIVYCLPTLSLAPLGVCMCWIGDTTPTGRCPGQAWINTNWQVLAQRSSTVRGYPISSHSIPTTVITPGHLSQWKTGLDLPTPLPSLPQTPLGPLLKNLTEIEKEKIQYNLFSCGKII